MALFVSLLTIFGYLFVKKMIDNKRDVRINRLKAKIRPLLFSYLSNANSVQTRLLQKEEISYKIIEELLDEYKNISKDDGVEERICIFAKSYLNEYYERLLNHRRWSIRMNVLYRIEDFQLSDFAETLWEKFQSKQHSREEIYQMHRIFAQFQYQPFITYLLTTDRVYPIFLYKEIIRKIQKKYLADLFIHISSLPQPFQIAIIDSIGEQRNFSKLSLIENLLESDDVEFRAQALKVIAKLGYVSDVDKIVAFASSSYFQERMMFTKVAAVLQKNRFKLILKELLHDPNWFVRNGAGEALSRYEDGDFILQHIMQTSSDPFARDMARQWSENEEEA